MKSGWRMCWPFQYFGFHNTKFQGKLQMNSLCIFMICSWTFFHKHITLLTKLKWTNTQTNTVHWLFTSKYTNMNPKKQVTGMCEEENVAAMFDCHHCKIADMYKYKQSTKKWCTQFTADTHREKLGNFVKTQLWDLQFCTFLKQVA